MRSYPAPSADKFLGPPAKATDHGEVYAINHVTGDVGVAEQEFSLLMKAQVKQDQMQSPNSWVKVMHSC